MTYTYYDNVGFNWNLAGEMYENTLQIEQLFNNITSLNYTTCTGIYRNRIFALPVLMNL